MTDHRRSSEMASEKASAEKASPVDAAGDGKGPATSNGKSGPESETEMETAPLSPPASAVAMKAVKGSGPAHEGEDPDATLTRPSPVMNDEVVRLCRDVLAPLVHADGGEFHLVVGNAEEIQIHLSGTCAGCPGAAMTRDRILAPVLVAALPKVRVTVTTGVRIPEGAVRIEVT